MADIADGLTKVAKAVNSFEYILKPIVESLSAISDSLEVIANAHSVQKMNLPVQSVDQEEDIKALRFLEKHHTIFQEKCSEKGCAEIVFGIEDCDCGLCDESDWFCDLHRKSKKRKSDDDE